MSITLSPRQAQLVQKSFSVLEPQLPQVVDAFYLELFRRAPPLRNLFPTDLSTQKGKLCAALDLVTAGASELHKLVPLLESLGEIYATYPVTNAHFDIAGAALLSALCEAAGEHWTEEVRAAWATLYGAVSAVMIAAMGRRRTMDAVDTTRSPQLWIYASTD